MWLERQLTLIRNSNLFFLKIYGSKLNLMNAQTIIWNIHIFCKNNSESGTMYGLQVVQLFWQV
ncbi:hypothetical protein CLOSPO_01537 [Clostridium sporogenes ATCC 15579]|nr:hypothetical protein CLOSPO_01537 [Clostridium sporogenes ATCC 15579]